MQIIQQRKAVIVEQYRLDFDRADTSDTSFSFSCDKQGNMLPDMPVPARENYEKCLSGEYKGHFVGVRDYSYTYNEPAHGRCECGHEVVLESSWANSCERCGREYNGSGQLLAPRCQWGDGDSGEGDGGVFDIWDDEAIPMY